MTKRPAGNGALAVDDESKSTVAPATDKATLATLARRWRVLRLGCPSGCPLNHHEPPCHLAEVRRGAA